jgi:preprotein translocase subunit SecG
MDFIIIITIIIIIISSSSSSNGGGGGGGGSSNSSSSSIKFLLLFCYIRVNSVILNSLTVTLIGSKATYRLDFLLSAL